MSKRTIIEELELALEQTRQTQDWLESVIERVNVDSATDRKLRRQQLKCSFCRPHQKENRGRRAKHGPQKPKRKGRGK